MSDSEAAAPAGWYPTPDGAMRYWDGVAWTEAVAPPPPPQCYGAVNDANQMAMLAHLGQLLTFIVPLVILLTRGKESDFVRRAAIESLNFWITGFFAAVVAFLLVFVLIGFLLLPIVGLVWLVMPIVAGLQANQGVDYRYPFNIRLLS